MSEVKNAPIVINTEVRGFGPMHILPMPESVLIKILTDWGAKSHNGDVPWQKIKELRKLNGKEG